MSSRDLSSSIQRLLTEKHLLSANEILEQLAITGRSYNKTSVYRALESLEKANTICRYDINDKEAQYELRADHHDHLICEQCNKIEMIDCQVSPPPAAKNFLVDHHHLLLFGTCEECQNIQHVSK